jgi:hypothetical protein
MQLSVAVPGATEIVLDDSVLDPFRIEPGSAAATSSPVLPRRCFAASHVAMLPGYAEVQHSMANPGSAEEIAEWIDWDTSMAFRKRLDGLGFGIAEAMDTAQRFELGWAGASRLIEETGRLGLTNGFVGAASADQADSIDSTADLSRAIAEQIAFVQKAGGIAIILPQPWMTQHGATEDDYVRVYCDAIDASEGPILLHWLGAPFHAAMEGYFPGNSLRTILAHDPAKVRGMKISMLDRELEESLRRSIATDDQVILTGDDYNFVPLIQGSSQESRKLPDLGGLPLRGGDFSHALLGILNAIAVPASLALQHLDRGDLDAYTKIMDPCEALGREIFKHPVQRYKSGIVFLAWLNGYQPNPMLVNHEEAARAREDYLRIAEMASQAGAIENAEAASARLRAFLGA